MSEEDGKVGGSVADENMVAKGNWEMNVVKSRHCFNDDADDDDADDDDADNDEEAAAAVVDAMGGGMIN